ncbi:MAG: hypothetical protein WA306_09380 [Candidatus Acidiferrales bacterium]
MATCQSTILCNNASWTDFLQWAGNSGGTFGTTGNTGISAALAQLGFTQVADTYSATPAGGSTWANMATNSALSNPNVTPLTGANLFGTNCFPTTTNNARAQLSGTAFQGIWVSGTSYTAGQVVYYTPASGGQQAFICISATSGSPTTPPAGNASSATYFAPYAMEIWEMVGVGGLDNIYFKIEYGCVATAGDPTFSIQFGTGYVSNSGVLSGNVSQVEQCILGTSTLAATECDFAGDGANWFGMFGWRNAATCSNFVAFERSISGQNSGAPVYSTTNQALDYIVGMAATPVWHQCSLLLTNGLGTTNSVRNAWVSGVNIHSAGSQIVNNITPALPIFPLRGWCGNPLSVAQLYSVTDATEGVVVQSTVYGSGTNYLVSINSNFIQAIGGVASIYGLGLKWQ